MPSTHPVLIKSQTLQIPAFSQTFLTSQNLPAWNQRSPNPTINQPVVIPEPCPQCHLHKFLEHSQGWGLPVPCLKTLPVENLNIKFKHPSHILMLMHKSPSPRKETRTKKEQIPCGMGKNGKKKTQTNRFPNTVVLSEALMGILFSQNNSA